MKSRLLKISSVGGHRPRQNFSKKMEKEKKKDESPLLDSDAEIENEDLEICEVCKIKNNHEMANIIDHHCGHVFGWECLEALICDSLEKDEFFQPKCPIKTCVAVISLTNLRKLLKLKKNASFLHFFTKCASRNCDRFTYMPFFKELDCSHLFCLECLNLCINFKMCLRCKEPLESGTRKKLTKMLTKQNMECRICHENAGKFEFKCCNLKICNHCFIKHFLNSYLKTETNEDMKLPCKYCWKNLASQKLSKILTKESVENYKILYKKLKKKICGFCRTIVEKNDIEVLEGCSHWLCKSCLEKCISKRAVCPIKECQIKLSSSMVKQYVKKEEMHINKEFDYN